jgi:hypothetical protein
MVWSTTIFQFQRHSNIQKFDLQWENKTRYFLKKVEIWISSTLATCIKAICNSSIEIMDDYTKNPVWLPMSREITHVVHLMHSRHPAIMSSTLVHACFHLVQVIRNHNQKNVKRINLACVCLYFACGKYIARISNWT